VPGGTQPAEDSEAYAAEFVAPSPKLASLDLKPAEWPVVEDERFEVKAEHARGGLGRVLEASDTRMDRPVAVKELLHGDRFAEARFIREALVTARLQHPGIVPVYEVGRWPSGKPFYSMKMVSGLSLAQLIKQKKTLAERLALLPNVIAVADAVAYAHQQRIIHRDLKPSNVMIGPFGETVVIDWGLAADLSRADRLLDAEVTSYQVAASGLTVAGTVMGTPDFMPPEQAQGRSADTRSDVYSLGAILYNVLAGMPPYSGKNSTEVLAKVAREEPAVLEKQQSGVPSDLAAIVRKAMSRDPANRYPTANDFAEELRRFQTGQLVGAYRYSKLTLISRWVRRHRAALTVALAVTVVPVFTIAASFQRIVKERNRAEEQARLVENSRNELILVNARTSLERDPTATIGWLKNYPATGARWSTGRNLAVDAESRGVARHVFSKGRRSEIAFSPDGHTIALANNEHVIQVLSLESSRPVAKLNHQGEIHFVRFSPDGAMVLFTDWKGSTLWLWEIASNRLFTLAGHHGAVVSVSFSSDGRLIASASSDGTVGLWSVATKTGKLLRGHNGPVLEVAFSSDNKFIASGSQDKRIILWNIKGDIVRTFHGHSGSIRALTFSPQEVLASSGMDGNLRLWNIATGKSRVLQGHSDMINEIAFSSNGNLVVTPSHDKTVRLWDVRTGETRVLNGHTGAVYFASFSPNGKLIASGGRDGFLRLHSVDGSQSDRVLRGHETAIYAVAFSPDGKYLASGSEDGTARVWSVEWNQARILRSHSRQIQDVAFSPDGNLVASAAADKLVAVTDLRDSGERVLVGHEDPVYRVRFSPDGRKLVSASIDGTVRMWDVATRESRILHAHRGDVVAVAFSPDANMLVTAGADATVRLWTGLEGSRVLGTHPGEVNDVAFAPGGRLVASASEDKTVRVWDLGSSDRTRVLVGHKGAITHVAFSRDQRMLASSSSDGTIGVWNLETESMRVLAGHTARINWVEFSADGSKLASAGDDHTVRLWDLRGGTSLSLAGHSETIKRIAFSPDSRLIASGSWDKSLRLWDVVTGVTRAVFYHEGHVDNFAFSPDGAHVASGSTETTVRIWPTQRMDPAPSEPTRFSEWMARLSTATLGIDDGRLRTSDRP
jgi:WD40 repeat protein/serine/threonine protein kinase